MQSSVCFFVLLMWIDALHLTKKRVLKRLKPTIAAGVFNLII